MDSGGARIGRLAGSLSGLMLLLLATRRHRRTRCTFSYRIDGPQSTDAPISPATFRQNSDVIARDASGRELGRSTTDVNGSFTFAARNRVDHYLVAETSDGHSSRPYRVPASLLPDSLAAPFPRAMVAHRLRLK